MSVLHVHSTYSLFDGAQTPDDICRTAKALGAKSVTLTDHGTLLGIDDFMAAGEKYGINAIPGVEAYTKQRQHLILVAKNYQGFQAISFAMKEANRHIEKVGRLVYPIMEDDILEQYFKGNPNVIATSACVNGPLGAILCSNDRIERKAAKYSRLCQMYQSDAERYQEAKTICSKLTVHIRERKKQLTADSRFLKPTFQKKIEKLKAKVVDAESQWLSVDGNVSYEKLKAELNSALLKREAAEKMVEEDKTAIAAMSAQLSEAKTVTKETKSAYDKYIKAKAKVDEFYAEHVPETELYHKAKERLLYLKSIFPEFYIELQYHGLDTEAKVMPLLLKLADETGTPIIGANDAHMSDKSDDSLERRRIMRFNYFQKSEVLSEPDRELYMKSDEELQEALAAVIPSGRAKEAVANTAILDCCKVVFPKGEHYPKTNDGVSFDELLEEAVAEKKAAGLWNAEYQKRLEHEVAVIKKMGYVDYHLVVRDFCNAGRILGVVPKEKRNSIPQKFEDAKAWIKANEFRDGIGIGPGRGSAAGSLVCYLLGITNIDPIRYGLLFERFLNPERVSMPDIDTDVATSLRGSVISYLKSKYGDGAVCSIATVTTYGAKGALQMAGRERANQLYGNQKNAKELISTYQKAHAYKLSDAVPEKPGITLADCETELVGIASGDPETQEVLRRAKLIEGMVCGTGVHAGGVIISDNSNVNEYVPLAWNDEKSVWVAQCDMIRAEGKGLLKMDLLGLNTLDIITDCLQLIGKYDHRHIDLNNVSFEPEVFSEIYAKGFTNSVFQFESQGMKAMLKSFKPTCFEDLILLVAAYRPGPMQYLDDIIEVKNGRKALTYRHPMLKSILSSTYGAVIYQEQVMQIFQKLAGYSLGGADLVRRAMSKKKVEKLAYERKAFIHGDSSREIDGCVKRGIPEETADALFDEMMEFAKYAFNKSHAAAYAFVSYQTAWLKYHYPAEFACAMFNNKAQDDFEPIISDCRQSGVRILPPDLNRSCFDFSLENAQGNGSRNVNFAVRYGIGGIKGIGIANRDTAARIVDCRKKDGGFTSVHDFLYRTAEKTEKKDGTTFLRTFPQKMFAIFTEAGLFDFSGQNREAVLAAFTKPIEAASDEALREKLDAVKIEYREPDTRYNRDMETRHLGTILSDNPLDEYAEAGCYGCIEIADLDSRSDGKVSVFGLLADYKELKTRNGNQMLLLNLQGKTGACEVPVFGADCSKYWDRIQELLYSVVKVSVLIRDGRIFFQTMAPMSNKVQEYVLKDASYRTSLEIAKVKKSNNQKGYIKVALLNYEGKSGKRHTYAARMFTMDEIRQCQARGINITPENSDQIPCIV